MDGVQPYVTIAVAILSIVGMMIIILNWRRSLVSRRRMYRMMLTCGIDETTARNPDELLDVDMRDARRRCRRCPAPETCDRWLNGEAIPCNEFCPNAARFMAAAESHRCRVTYDLARRPGRRLD